MKCKVWSAGHIGRELRSGEFYRDVLAEFVATFMLMAVQSSTPLQWDNGANLGTAVQVGVSMGFIVCTMAWSLGDFGGGHMNPAVSISMLMACKISIVRAICYVIAQCLGAIAGAAFILVVTPYDNDLGLTALNSGMAAWQGFLVELWITCILIFTILGSTNLKRKNGNLFMPTIPIGFAVALGIMSAFKHTGGSMNPARSLGPAVVRGKWEHHWIYWAGPIAGGALAVLLYCGIFDRVGRKRCTEDDCSPDENGKMGHDNIAADL